MRTPQAIIEMAETWDWRWKLVGNETDEEKADLDQMLAAAQGFVASIIAGEDPRWLTLCGKSGAGKTHLAERISEWMRRFGPGMYERHHRSKIDPQHQDYLASYVYAQEGRVLVKWGTLIEEARSREFNRYQRACKDYYKVIDDLGVNSMGADGKPTAFAIQTMAEVLDRRLRRWTVITSNFSRKQFAEEFDVRIASRLMRDRNVIVEANVRDYAIRQEKAA
jgi:DNA replication protein DnaC